MPPGDIRNNSLDRIVYVLLTMSEVGVEHVMRSLEVDIGGWSGDGDVSNAAGGQHLAVGNYSNIAFPAPVVFSLRKGNVKIVDLSRDLLTHLQCSDEDTALQILVVGVMHQPSSFSEEVWLQGELFAIGSGPATGADLFRGPAQQCHIALALANLQNNNIVKFKKRVSKLLLTYPNIWRRN